MTNVDFLIRHLLLMSESMKYVCFFVLIVFMVLDKSEQVFLSVLVEVV